MSTQDRPQDWKNYDDFAAGIDTNRLPQSRALDGRSFDLRFDDARTLHLAFAEGQVAWSDADGAGSDPCDVVEVAPSTYFVDVAFATRATQASTLMLNTATRRVLCVTSIVREAGEVRGEPRVAQVFRPGIIGNLDGALGAVVPAPSRDLIGLRAHFTYSPQHTYEHTYLSSERYCWQCLVGVQRGHGDVDLTTTYKFDDNQYVFTFREFLIPVASVFFYNFDAMRSTGKFLGITGAGQIENSRAGALIRKASMTFYLPGQEPV
ncbi:MoaF N-terminal domain-containing protein [Bradyrhizobium sp. U87765 SZCCT0131]|uniref:MoaF C-terminal domain-containing protein n=1 Tax=unclassified Bradyrhizobium TaxID=2631580 RepID=UPI001BAC511D|nr:MULTISPECIES: MoaF C-terminal domain-containing protein [unclassified Bradyrhizobium]MBR1217728.1 MoaF N-terminal domain-containing protein [Bradyrhizobium sp. U87765 SZCCT0131]MBR1261326.1 MoaF N-terminal domain-containing protein [Bradyrhizobium sp. U87765 SZCCT0134]MBR1303226.1 MoaF N-terminal domain-containing protein [Bradyrhizobium sp. U87765 SZCCT0110]MBR1318832.1 MoaF N-terminal domain-containing protein [Bradyrhizobium sp. U87765 SZCCT0109]MBR1347157.1 MoaF N-terminal domain-contai